MVAWDGFSELLSRPVCCGMRSHVVMHNTTAADFHDEQHEQHLEPDSHCHQKIAGDDPLGMILDERSPVLRGGPSATRSSPQVMFSLTMRAMSRRMSWGSAGRPPRDFQRQYSLKASRCQRTKVRGVTMASASFQSKSRDQRTNDNRAASVRRRGRIW
jgi:hypothetical protein